jgi:hypothetical protein
MKTSLILLAITFGGLVIAGLQRRFSKETLVNGLMNRDKAEDLCPSFFKAEEKEPSGKD